MRKDFDPNAVSDISKYDTSGDGIVSTTEISDYEMREQQRIWVSRLANIFNFLFGLLGGIGLLDLFILLSIPGREQYVASFRALINVSCGLQQILTTFAISLGGTLSLIYSKKADDMSRNKESQRLEFQQLSWMSGVATFAAFLSWVPQMYVPKFSNQMYYAGIIAEDDFVVFKWLNVFKAVLFVIVWMLVSCNNRSAVISEDIDPHADELSDEEDDIGKAETAASEN